MNTPTLDQAFRAVVREVVKEELDIALGAPAIAPLDLYKLVELPKVTKVSLTTLKKMKKGGELLPAQGEGRLARYTRANVAEACALHARAKGGSRSKAADILRRRS